jgi:O-antigen ligase
MFGREEHMIIEPGNKGRKRGWLYEKFVVEKMNNWPGVLTLLASAILIAYITAFMGIKGAAMTFAGIAAIPMVFAIIVYPQFGILTILILSYFIFSLIRLDLGIPAGTLADGVEMLLLFGFFLKQKAVRDWSIVRDPVGIMLLIWIGYNLLQIANPTAASRMSWVYTIRSVAFVMFLYFVFSLHIRTIRFVRIILGTWIALSTCVALYALKQQYIGFSSAESAWLENNELARSLLFIAGQWRKFSFLSDPVVFAYTMVISTILCVCIAGATKRTWLKVTLYILAAIYTYVMLFSGTRAAYILLPVAMAFYAILNFNRKVLFFLVVMGAFTVFLILLPTGNPTLYRFQSAFKPSTDASFNLRKANQERIRPFIYSHPFGGGLGATGVWGQRFAPESFLASFPPDSGYVRVAVELGWIGLILFGMLMFVIIKTGIDNYFRIRNPELKAYCLAMLLIVFVLNIANYPQEAFVQFPTNIYFYLVVALIGVTARIDKEIVTATHE